MTAPVALTSGFSPALHGAVLARVIALLLLAGCDAAASTPPARTPPVQLACTCGDAERCEACFRLVGRCCYEDEEAGGQLLALTARCEASTTCRSCCDECAALDCDELIAGQGCPPIEPP